MKRFLWLCFAVSLVAPVVARPVPRVNTNPGADRVTPVTRNTNPGLDSATPGATYVKWDVLTTTQQEAMAKGWGLDPVESAAKWNALEVVDQNSALVKYAKFKVISPRH